MLAAVFTLAFILFEFPVEQANMYLLFIKYLSVLCRIAVFCYFV